MDIRQILCGFTHGVDTVQRLQLGIDEPPAEAGIEELAVTAERTRGLAQNPRSTGHVLHSTCEGHLPFAEVDGACGVHGRG